MAVDTNSDKAHPQDGNFGLLTVIIPFPSGKVPRFPQGQLSHYPHHLRLDHLHRHQGWGGVWEGMLAMKGAHKGKDGAVQSRNRGMGERPPGDPNLPLPSNVFPLIQPITASSQKIWLIFQSTADTPNVFMSGMEVAMVLHGTTTIDDVEYKVYKSESPYTGTFNVQLF